MYKFAVHSELHSLCTPLLLVRLCKNVKQPRISQKGCGGDKGLCPPLTRSLIGVVLLIAPLFCLMSEPFAQQQVKRFYHPYWVLTGHADVPEA